VDVSNVNRSLQESLTLIHTNDFHNRLTEAQANRLRLLRDSMGANGLLLDAGDAISSGNVTYRPGGEPILDRMTAIGYDAMTVGNREFHLTRVGFHCKLSRAGFPVLCANVRPTRTPVPSPPETAAASEVESRDDALPVRPILLCETASGWRVVIFGLTVPMITERMFARKVSAYVFDDPLTVAANLVPQLRVRYAPDLLIALTHIGIARDRLLAASVPGIDLIIGGHSHVVLEQGERVGETLIAQAGCWGHYFGRIEAHKENSDERPCLRATLETL